MGKQVTFGFGQKKGRRHAAGAGIERGRTREHKRPVCRGE
jgi:hypothetical protein